MSHPQRFKVGVTVDGAVTITGPNGQPLTAQPPKLASIPQFLAREEGEPAPAALTGQLGYWERDAFLGLLSEDDQEINQIWEPYHNIYKREEHDDNDLRTMGRFLFDKLIGDTAWQEIEGLVAAGESIELALLFENGLEPLHRFNWELMYKDEFLATKRTAITRLVRRTVAGSPRLFLRPPRVLFVIGTSYTDKRVRPGAEYFSLMRQLEADGLSIHPRVLQLASPPEIRATIESFEPDVVHYICHGTVDRDGQDQLRGCLELQTENKKGTLLRFGDEILADLGAGGGLPPIVVLSACDSGALPFTGAAQIGSLAAELVAGGVPFVVGMGGSISDAACRLFTRRFGEAVISGEPLVGATAEGRWAAYIDRTPQTMDWAYPTLFMAEDVGAEYVPVDQQDQAHDPSARLKQRYLDYGIPRYPVFCSRHRFFDRFHSLFSAPGESVLAIFTRDDTPGIGRTRLLQELAAQALREGHVPVLVSRTEKGWAPHFENVTQLAVELLRAIKVAREAFGLAPLLEMPLMKRLVQKRPPDDLAELEEDYGHNPSRLCDLLLSRFMPLVDPQTGGLGQAGIDDVWPADDLRVRLSSEFERLIVDARAMSESVDDQSRVVVLLDQVHEYDKAVDPLFNHLINDYGLGDKDEPVPVILCYSKKTPADKTLEASSEKNSVRWWLEELQEFQEGEDLLAYEQVMLNPDPSSLGARTAAQHLHMTKPDEVDSPVIAFAYNPRAKDIEEWTKYFRQYLGTLPTVFTQDALYMTFVAACHANFLVTADDELRLRKLSEAT